MNVTDTQQVTVYITVNKEINYEKINYKGDIEK